MPTFKLLMHVLSARCNSTVNVRLEVLNLPISWEGGNPSQKHSNNEKFAKEEVQWEGWTDKLDSKSDDLGN